MSEIDSINELKSRAEAIISKKYEQKQKPNLSEDQILDILSVIPAPVTIESNTRKLIWNKLVEITYKSLKNKYVNPKAIPKLKRALKYYIQTSFAVPGTPIGISSIADDIGAGALQSALDARKKPGSRQNAAGGIKMMKEVFQLSKRSMPIVTVYFEEKQSFNDIMTEWRRKLVQIQMKDLVTSHEIGDTDGVYTQPEWYSKYAKLRTNIDKSLFEIPETNLYEEFIVLKINTNTIYAYKLNPELIYQKLKHLSNFKVLYPPGVLKEIHLIPILDTYISKEERKSGSESPALEVKSESDTDTDQHTTGLFTSGEISSDTQVDNNIYTIIRETLPKLLDINISGIPGITYIYPIGISLKGAIIDEKKINTNEYEIRISKIHKKRDGIDEQQVANLFTATGATIVSLEPLIVKKDDVNMTPLEYLNKAINDDLIDQTEYENRKRRERYAGQTVSLIRPPSDIELLSKHYYIECTGGTYSHFNDIEGIDMTRTYSNNIKEMNRLFGIENARSLLVKEIDSTYQNSGLSLESVTIETAASKMTYVGFLVPYTYTGIGVGRIGALAKSTLQRPLNILQTATVNKEIDPLNSVSGSIMVGKPISVGTGLPKTISKEVEYYPTVDDDNDFSSTQQVCTVYDQ